MIFWEELSPQKVSSLKKKELATSWKKNKIPEVQESLAALPWISELLQKLNSKIIKKLVLFFQLLRKDGKVLVTTEMVQQFNEINQDLDRCSQLALMQPLPNKQLILMSEASFTAAGYAISTEDDPNQKFTSVKKSFAPIAYGSKTFTPSQLKMSICAKECLAICSAIKEFGDIF